jgi:hypothetical protein
MITAYIVLIKHNTHSFLYFLECNEYVINEHEHRYKKDIHIKLIEFEKKKQ